MVPIEIRVLLFAVGALVLAVLVARLVFPAPTPEPQKTGRALPPAAEGVLTEAMSTRAAQHPGQSGIAALSDGMEAYVARMVLANAAASSIDAQYYIWRNDMTGHLFLQALWRAAERGVRVRLLLDDNGIHDLDGMLATLDSHPNIEVRLFNPFVLRRFKRLSYAFDLFRLNHRMHNKAFTVDGRVSILGGRNIGDEYFGTGEIPLQMDLDVLAVGAVVPEISADFDRYWNADATHSAARILDRRADPEAMAARFHRVENDPRHATYRAQLEQSDLVSRLATGGLALEWTNATLISDDPARVFDRVPRSKRFTARLLDAIGPIEHRFDGVTPYFVPGEAGVAAFTAMVRNGVTVRMLTNSLEATNMLPVHAGYSKRRAPLLCAGVGLFELRAQAAGASERDRLGPLGSSGSNLHAKTFAVDGARIFIGSFNFDPRSALLNTEMGLVIESERMAQVLHEAFDRGLGGMAWQVKLERGKPVWIDTEEAIRTDDEPGTTLVRRIALRVIGWLPVEWLL